MIWGDWEEEGEANLSLGEQDQLLFHESKDKKKVKKFLKGMDKDLDRIKEKHSELISVTEDQVLIKEPIKFPLRASQIPTEDPGEQFPPKNFVLEFRSEPFSIQVVLIEYFAVGVALLAS